MNDRTFGLKTLLSGLLMAAAVTGPSVATADTATFQNGLNGYNGTAQFRITADGGAIIDAGVVLLQGDMGDPTADPPVPVDPYKVRYGFWRFNDIIGTGAGQIPMGSTILSARLEIKTVDSTRPFGLSNGPYVVARLLWDVPFIPNIPNWTADATDWDSFEGGAGPTLGTDYDRPVGGFIDMQQHSTFKEADVTSIVQAWAKGAGNYGFIVMGNTSDYWTVEGIGNPSPASRPRLVVEYVPKRSRTLVFQQGVDGYSGCAMLRVGQNNTTLLGDAIDVTTSDAYLDGGTGPADPEFDALIRFNNIFGSGPSQIASGKQILKAYLTLTTASRSDAEGSRSMGPYSVHRMLVDVDWTGTSHPAKPFLWSEFANADGPTVGSEVGPAISGAHALGYESRPYFDVTDAVLAWQSGEANYGVVIKPATTDGWKIHWTASTPESMRPQLIVLLRGRPADLNNDTYVDEADLTQLLGCAEGPAMPYGAGCEIADLDEDLDVDSTDFGLLQACFNGSMEASPACRVDPWIEAE